MGVVERFFEVLDATGISAYEAVYNIRNKQ